MMTDEQLVMYNFEEKVRCFTEIVDGQVWHSEALIIAHPKLPTDTFNTAIVKAEMPTQIEEVQQRLDELEHVKHPYSVWFEASYADQSWRSFFEQYQLREAERTIMMKLENTQSISAQTSTQLDIVKVTATEELDQYIDVFTSLFAGSSEKEALDLYFQRFSLVETPNTIQLFIGLQNNQPVSTGLLIETAYSYGIYDVMTKEKARGNGYGSEMFRHLLTQTALKEKPVVLQASDDGENIYKRFGFTEVGEMVVFEKA